MKRRDFIMLLGGAAAWPLAARAQQKAMPVIGFLSPASPVRLESFMAAFRQGLSEAGYVEGQNLTIEYRWAEGHYDRLPALAADLVDRKVDLIVAIGACLRHSRRKMRPRRSRSSLWASRPGRAGLVASLARPGGNVTGFSMLSAS